MTSDKYLKLKEAVETFSQDLWSRELKFGEFVYICPMCQAPKDLGHFHDCPFAPLEKLLTMIEEVFHDQPE